MRTASVARITSETDIALSLALEGEGKGNISTGVGFFDHMLTALCKYAAFDIDLTCKGDLNVDCHHTVEDCGIALGGAIAEALGNRAGIARIAHSYVPMDEALAFCAIDLSNRGFLAYSAEMSAPMIGAYDTQTTEEFLRALAVNGGITMHVSCQGRNAHHVTEAIYKAVGRALRGAVEKDNRIKGIPSTKGVI